MVIFNVWIVLINTEQKTNLNHIKKCVKIDFYAVVTPDENKKSRNYSVFKTYQSTISYLCRSWIFDWKISGYKQYKFIDNKIRQTYSVRLLLAKICAFDDIKNKHDVYWRKDCLKELFKSWTEHAVEMTNF